MRGGVHLLAPTVALALATAAPSLASRPLTWTEDAAGLSKGRADGMAVSDLGRLFLAPRVTPVGAEGDPAHPAQVWAAVSDAEGNVYLGTGPEGRILKIDRSGNRTVLFAAEEPLVTALAVTPEGDLLAGAVPGGKIYRIDRGGRGAVWSETGERYVWSLAVTTEGRVYAGTGEAGRLLRIHRSGNTEQLFDSDDSHIVSLVALPDGSLLAGGAGRGRVYHVDAEGHALVLHEDDLPEVAALASAPDGDLFAALLAPPRPASRRPALRLRLPDGVDVGVTDDSVGTLEESKGPVLRGTIEGLGEEVAGRPLPTRGRVVRIRPDGTVREIWSSSYEAPFCLVRDERGRLLFGTGEPARLYRFDPSVEEVALLATLREAHLTGLVRAGRSTLLASSNPAVTYRLEERAMESGVFLSRPFDAGGPARWGSIRWNVENPSGRTELYTRTGNSREPDETWSGWSPALSDPRESTVDNPPGRYLQWRVRQVGSQDPVTRVHGVTVRYEPFNRPPAIRDLRAEPAGGTAERTTLHWSAADPDGDPVGVRFEVRSPGSAEWSVAGEHLEKAPTDPAASGEAWKKGRWDWETAALEEGTYELRAVATDAASNARGEGIETGSPTVLTVVVDRTPPEIELLPSSGTVRVRVADAHSDLRSVEVLLDGRLRFTARAEDGLCDSRLETFSFELPPSGSGEWTVRGEDAAGNAAEHPLPAPGGPR